MPRDLIRRSEDTSSSNHGRGEGSADPSARAGFLADQRIVDDSLVGGSIQPIRAGDGVSTVPGDSASNLGKLELWRGFIDDHNRLIKRRIRADELRRKARDRRKNSSQQNREVILLIQQFSAQIADTNGDGSQHMLQDIMLAKQNMVEAEQRMVETDEELESQEQAIIDLEAKISGSFPHIENFEAERALRVLIENRLGLQDDESSGGTRCDSSHPSELSTIAREVREILNEIDLIEEVLGARKAGSYSAQPITSPSADENEYLELESDVLEARLKNFRINLELCRDRGRAGSPLLSENSRSMLLVNDQQRAESQRRSPLRVAHAD